MKILQVHNYYQYHGGEDQVFLAEAVLLRSKGHEVIQFTIHNDTVNAIPSYQLPRKSIWNDTSFNEIRQIIRREHPQIAHFHNIFPLISPSAYYACSQENLPVIQTLHNYRLLCVNALFFRNGKVCEDCLGKGFPWPGVIHSCYRSSKPASFVVASMLGFHNAKKTWKNKVTRYITLTEFARKKFIEGGILPQNIDVKSNFVAPDPGVGNGNGGFALYVGRLSTEKGIEILLKAWEKIGEGILLKIVGVGPLSKIVKDFCDRHIGVQWMGNIEHSEVLGLMKNAKVLIFPSLWYEGMPNTIIEAFACGLPVLASDLGSFNTMVQEGKTGLLFRAGDIKDLIDKVYWILNNDSSLLIMRQEARQEYEQKYTAEKNYSSLISIYKHTLEIGVR